MFYLSNIAFSNITYTPDAQLISLTFNSSMVSCTFPASVRNAADPCFFSSMSANAFEILNSCNHAYDELFSKDGGALKFDAISESLLSQSPCENNLLTGKEYPSVTQCYSY